MKNTVLKLIFRKKSSVFDLLQSKRLHSIREHAVKRQYETYITKINRKYRLILYGHDIVMIEIFLRPRHKKCVENMFL